MLLFSGLEQHPGKDTHTKAPFLCVTHRNMLQATIALRTRNNDKKNKEW